MDIAEFNNKWLTWNIFIEWAETKSACRAVSFSSFDSFKISFVIRSPQISLDTTKRYIKFSSPRSEFFVYKNGVLSISRTKEGWELILEGMEKAIIYTGEK
jgi:hypothetical protein